MQSPGPGERGERLGWQRQGREESRQEWAGSLLTPPPAQNRWAGRRAVQRLGQSRATVLKCAALRTPFYSSSS